MREYRHAAETLTQWLDDRQMTAAELSRCTGIDAGILRNIVTGRQRTISTRNLMVLARYFDMSMKEIIDYIA